MEPERADILSERARAGGEGAANGLAHASGELGFGGQHEQVWREGGRATDRGPREGAGGVGDPLGTRLEGFSGDGYDGNEPGWDDKKQDRPAPSSSDGTSVWTDSHFIPCSDGKLRRVPLEPALFPLAPGLSGRVGLLRGAGNAIVPPLAAEFIRAAMEH